MEPQRILEAIRAALEPAGHPFALAGAFALNAHGLGRMTADLDLVVPLAAQGGLIGAMERLGFETLHCSEGFSNHLHRDPALGRVDFIYVDEATAAQLFSASRPLPFGSTQVLVPKPEHLIAMKVQAIRNDPARRLRDLADIQFLLSVPGVDREQARRYFEKAGLGKDWDEVSE